MPRQVIAKSRLAAQRIQIRIELKPRQYERDRINLVEQIKSSFFIASQAVQGHDVKRTYAPGTFLIQSASPVCISR